jgi:hypothetical protein
MAQFVTPRRSKPIFADVVRPSVGFGVLAVIQYNSITLYLAHLTGAIMLRQTAICQALFWAVNGFKEIVDGIFVKWRGKFVVF